MPDAIIIPIVWSCAYTERAVSLCLINQGVPFAPLRTSSRSQPDVESGPAR